MNRVNDMQNKINKIIWIIVFILFVFMIGTITYQELKSKKSVKAYDERIYYMDTYIYIKVYEHDSKKALEALEGATSIYKKYHELTDRYNGYPGLKNIYYIHNNDEEDEYIEIDSRLYDILELALVWKDKSNGLFDIGQGDLIDVWRKYKEGNNGLPTLEELESTTSSEIVLKDGKILNNHANIDLGGIAKGYATEEVGKYLESIGINKYIINAGGNVLVGKHYDNDAYKVGIEDPTNSDSSIFMKVKAEDKAIVTSGGYQRFFEVDGKRYNHIINPNTKYPADNFLSVTVITDSSALADILSTMLFMMDLDSALEFVNQLDDVEAVFYLSKEEQIMSDGFNRYLYE